MDEIFDAIEAAMVRAAEEVIAIREAERHGLVKQGDYTTGSILLRFSRCVFYPEDDFRQLVVEASQCFSAASASLISCDVVLFERHPLERAYGDARSRTSLMTLVTGMRIAVPTRSAGTAWSWRMV